MKSEVSTILHSYEKFSIISENGKVALKRFILDGNDIDLLCRSIYAIGYLGKYDDDIVEKSLYLLKFDRRPQLSAACLRLLINQWGVDGERFFDLLSWFVEVDRFDGFFDENLIILCYVLKNRKIFEGSLLIEKCLLFEEWASNLGYLHDIDLMI